MADGGAGFQNKTGHDGRRSAPDEVWAAVRDDYLAGVSAPECCRRHGVGLSSLRLRAGREGWRRADQPWTPPRISQGALDPWDEGRALEDRVGGDLDRVDCRELAWIAHRRMQRAILRGEASEALRWRRVREIMDAETADLDHFLEAEEARDALDASDASDGVFGGGGAGPAV